MIHYTGWQYLLIDAANNFGLDKLLFEERIEWAEAALKASPMTLEALANEAPVKTRPQYLKAVMAIRKAQQGLPTGHLVGLDACCSGIQVMSALTGCVTGADATGMINPNVRADAYTKTTEEMAVILGGNVDVDRADAKKALMTLVIGVAV